MADPVKAPDPHKKTKSRTRIRIAILVTFYIVATLLQFTFEHAERLTEYVHLPHRLESGFERTAAFLNTPFRYIPRPTEARYAALVSITEDSEGPLRGPCDVRAFLVQLLPAIVRARPNIVVLDVAPADDDRQDACDTKSPETMSLRAAVQAATETTPLVIGQPSSRLDDLTEERAQRLLANGFRVNDLLLRKPIQLTPKPQDLAFGLVWPNQDIEKVPIDWEVHQSETSGAEPFPSLAFAAAKLYRSTIPNGEERFEQLESKQYHPVADLLPENSFALIPAISLLCSSQPGDRDWRNCPRPTDFASQRMLHGRIVVVGFGDHHDDQWNTRRGRMPGFVLHANYIEALLDARAFRPLTFWMTCLLSLLWLLLVEVPYWIPKLSILKAISFSVLISLLVVFLVQYVALVNLGLYINLFAPSVLLLAVSVLHVLSKHFEE